MTNADFLIRESESEYREKAKTHLSSHALADFRKCPLLYWKKKQGLVPDEDRPAYVVGRAAHKLILEGREAFDDGYAVGGPINPKTGEVYGARTKAYAEWASAQGKPVLTDEQFALIANLTTGVRSHRLAIELLSDGLAEGVVRVGCCGLPVSRASTSSIPSADSSTSKPATTSPGSRRTRGATATRTSSPSTARSSSAPRARKFRST